MKTQIKIFSILICTFFFSLVSFPQKSDQNFLSEIQKIIDDPFFDQTTISIDIFDLTDSISIYNKSEKLLLRPASNMKLLTSAASLINLGNDYLFRTDFYHTGVIEENKLYGDLYVVGGFDPIFSLTDLDSVVSIINSLGIKEITGGIYGDISKKDSLYWGKGWMWDDDPDPTAPYLSALNINYNSIEVFVEGSEINYPASVTLIPNTEFVEVENNSVTVDENSVEEFFVTRDWVNRKNKIIIDGEIRKTSIIDSSENLSKINLLYPEKYFLTLLNEKLEREGIQIDKPIEIKIVPENAVYLTCFRHSIDTVLSIVNKESDNLSAEMLIYAMAYQDSGSPASANNGLQAIKKFIDSLGFSADNYSIADGSGVSHYNLVSAEVLLESLKYMYFERKDLFELFFDSLPIAGEDGTLEKRMKNTSAQKNVHAKTGTLNGVSNLSGYVTTKGGHLLAFSIMIQNFVSEYSTARNFQNMICELLADYE